MPAHSRKVSGDSMVFLLRLPHPATILKVSGPREALAT